MSEARERLKWKMLAKRGAKACAEYEKMFNQSVPIQMPDGYPTNNEKYLQKVEECIRRGTPLTAKDLDEAFPTEEGVLY